MLDLHPRRAGLNALHPQGDEPVTRDEILETPSMPAFSPSYPRGPYRFLRREYLIVTYETDADAIRAGRCPSPWSRTRTTSSSTSG